MSRICLEIEMEKDTVPGSPLTPLAELERLIFFLKVEADVHGFTVTRIKRGETESVLQPHTAKVRR